MKLASEDRDLQETIAGVLMKALMDSKMEWASARVRRLENSDVVIIEGAFGIMRVAEKILEVIFDERDPANLPR